MARDDDMNEDEQVPTTEPIAPQEPSEAVVVEFDGLPGTITPADPFAGFLQDNATIRVGTWAGFPNYECSACQYASLDEAKTQAHISIHGQTFTQGARP